MFGLRSTRVFSARGARTMANAVSTSKSFKKHWPDERTKGVAYAKAGCFHDRKPVWLTLDMDFVAPKPLRDYRTGKKVRTPKFVAPELDYLERYYRKHPEARLGLETTGDLTAAEFVDAWIAAEKREGLTREQAYRFVMFEQGREDEIVGPTHHADVSLRRKHKFVLAQTKKITSDFRALKARHDDVWSAYADELAQDASEEVSIDAEDWLLHGDTWAQTEPDKFRFPDEEASAQEKIQDLTRNQTVVHNWRSGDSIIHDPDMAFLTARKKTHIPMIPRKKKEN